MLATMLLAIRNMDWHATDTDVALVGLYLLIVIVYIMLMRK